MTSSLAFVPNVSTLVWLVWTPQLELSWDYIKSNESKEIMTLINETSEIPILETLESLLTNVEFIIKDSMITNLIVEDSTTDVTENDHISTLRYSIHNRCWKRQWWIFTWTEVPPNLVTELSSSPSTSTSSMYLNSLEDGMEMDGEDLGDKYLGCIINYCQPSERSRGSKLTELLELLRTSAKDGWVGITIGCHLQIC